MKRLFCIAIGIVLTFALTFSTKNTQAQNSTNLPLGKWTLTAGPYFGPSFNSRPAMVSSVTTNRLQRITVTSVQVVNNSSLPISAVKFTWMLTDDPECQRVLLFGTTQLIPTPEIKSGGYAEIDFPVVSFLDQAHKLTQKGKGKLEGDFRISVAVTEIAFIDGSSWEDMIPEVVSSNVKEARVQPVAFRKIPKSAKFSVTPFVVSARQSQCPKQKCTLVSQPPFSYYMCSDSTFAEFCTNCVVFCCNSICGGPPPRCSCA